MSIIENLSTKIDISTRYDFLRKTYSHLLMAIVLFVAVEVMLFTSGVAFPLAQAMLSVTWLAILGGFMIVGWIASHFVESKHSVGVQYAALIGYVLAQAILFVPLLVMAEMSTNADIISNAAIVTLLAFTGLTALVVTTKKDFSFMGVFLKWVAICALVLIVLSVLFSFSLGLTFSVAMVLFAGAAILYDTSNVLYRFPEDQHVAASLQLFSSVALMFWYVLRIFLSRR